MEIYIWDASVVVNLLLGKNNQTTVQAAALLKKAEAGDVLIYGPALLVFEVGNSLRFALDESLLANEPFQQFLDIPIKYFELDEGHYLQILKQSYSLQTSFYDTSYHFLALLLGGTFLTADRDYFKRAKSLGSIELV